MLPSMATQAKTIIANKFRIFLNAIITQRKKRAEWFEVQSLLNYSLAIKYAQYRAANLFFPDCFSMPIWYMVVRYYLNRKVNNTKPEYLHDYSWYRSKKKLELIIRHVNLGRIRTSAQIQVIIHCSFYTMWVYHLFDYSSYFVVSRGPVITSHNISEHENRESVVLCVHFSYAFSWYVCGWFALFLHAVSRQQNLEYWRETKTIESSWLSMFVWHT